jgi:hypothetical protein
MFVAAVWRTGTATSAPHTRRWARSPTNTAHQSPHVQYTHADRATTAHPPEEGDRGWLLPGSQSRDKVFPQGLRAAQPRQRQRQRRRVLLAQRPHQDQGPRAARRVCRRGRRRRMGGVQRPRRRRGWAPASRIGKQVQRPVPSKGLAAIGDESLLVQRRPGLHGRIMLIPLIPWACVTLNRAEITAAGSHACHQARLPCADYGPTWSHPHRRAGAQGKEHGSSCHAGELRRHAPHIPVARPVPCMRACRTPSPGGSGAPRRRPAAARRVARPPGQRRRRPPRRAPRAGLRRGGRRASTPRPAAARGGGQTGPPAP